MTRMPPWRLVVIGLAACTACAPAVNSPSTPQVRAEVQALSREALSKVDRATPGPPPCSRGWAESSAGYVVVVAEWAEQAGLRPGDQVVEVGGAKVTASDERARAYARVPTGGPLELTVLRQGRPVTLAPNAVTYVDTSVHIGVSYCYRVRAFRASSYSNPSNEACAMPNPSTSPGGGR